MSHRTLLRKVSLSLVAAAALCGAAIGSPAVAEDTAAASASVTFATDYVWRGLRVTDDPVLQPSVTVSGKGFTANWWGNVNTTDFAGTDTEWKLNESDYTLSYGKTLGKVALSVGGVQYTFPLADDQTALNTVELFGTVGVDTLLQPKLSAYWDVDEAGGAYYSLAIGHTFALPEVAKGVAPSLALSASLGYSDEEWSEFNYGLKEGGFADVLAGATLTVPVGALSISAFVNYSAMVDSKLADAVEASKGDSAVLFGGATVAYNF